jgi:hypothetical protein
VGLNLVVRRRKSLDFLGWLIAFLFSNFFDYLFFIYAPQTKTLQNTLATLCQSTGWLSTLFLRPRYCRRSNKYTTRIRKWTLRSVSRKLLSRLGRHHRLHPHRGNRIYFAYEQGYSKTRQQQHLKTAPTWPETAKSCAPGVKRAHVRQP